MKWIASKARDRLVNRALKRGKYNAAKLLPGEVCIRMYENKILQKARQSTDYESYLEKNREGSEKHPIISEKKPAEGAWNLEQVLEREHQLPKSPEAESS